MAEKAHTKFEGRRVEGHRPWPRTVVKLETWMAAVERLVDGRSTLLGLWAEPNIMHMALFENASSAVDILSLDCPDGRYTSVARRHPPAIRLERAARDLFGLVPMDGEDSRPWLDHGRWGMSHPLGARGPAIEHAPYSFMPTEGESLHQIPVGPVHAGIIEPGHFRFTANGETIVRLEERLGYVHKGVEGLMAGADLARAAGLAGRLSGDATVAYAFAFARAVEAALGFEAPPRAVYLRALMAELERLANHLGDIGAVCNDAAFALMLAHCAVLRERVLRAGRACFGHRLMRDRIVPGGVAADLADAAPILELVAEIRARFPALVDLYDNTASIKQRTVTTGILKPALARQYGAGGFVGRASERAFDARRALAYPPYDELEFDVPILRSGDVNARVWIRIQEVEQSLRIIDQILDRLPGGETRVSIPAADAVREGVGIVESFRGDVLVWLRLAADGTVERCHLRDPSWFQWPLLEAVVEDNIVADFPLCNKSFNCSYSGHDL